RETCNVTRSACPPVALKSLIVEEVLALHGRLRHGNRKCRPCGVGWQRRRGNHEIGVLIRVQSPPETHGIHDWQGGCRRAGWNGNTVAAVDLCLVLREVSVRKAFVPQERGVRRIVLEAHLSADRIQQRRNDNVRLWRSSQIREI